MKLRFLYTAIFFMVFTVVVFAGGSSAEVRSPANVRGKMDRVYTTFRDLQPYLVDEDRFNNDDNSSDITRLIGELSGVFHSDGLSRSKFADDPGFSSTLKVLNDMLDDSRIRFVEGRKAYAMWRLKTAVNYCVTCHTRYEVPTDFVAPSEPRGLTAYEKGEFYLATRQFDKAGDEFLKVARKRGNSLQRMNALRKWILVYTRVQPAPHEALKTLNSLNADIELSSHEQEELSGWIGGLRRWANESAAAVDPLRRAENLLRQGVGMHDPLAARSGAIELLRATALLHRELEQGGIKISAAARSRQLYLLGLAYSELPFFFINELPEMFLEQSIRENPDSDDARRAYGLYRRIVTLGFTGSGGTQLPADVTLSLKELHDLAYGVKKFHERI